MATSVKTIEHLLLSPPPGSVPPTTLTLTFFDAIWLDVPPVQRLFFYNFPGPTQDFQSNHLPLLLNSLSLALKLFFPLAARILVSPESGDPVISYANDSNSVSVTLAESNADFDSLVADHPKDVKAFHSLVPSMPGDSGDDGKPLLAVQITVFPCSGVCLGISVDHAVADGTSSIHFMKSWASIFKYGGDVLVVKNPPLFDRSAVAGVEDLKRGFLEDRRRAAKRIDFEKVAATGKGQGRVVRSTFVLTRDRINHLRNRIISAGTREMGPRVSTFVATSAYVWVCLLKSRGPECATRTAHFAFAVDCRSRLSPPVPATYFGNCIGAAFVEAPGTELAGDEGLAIAAEAIQRSIKELDEDVLRGGRYWIPRFGSLVSEGILSIAGSPRLGVYETDFGWGRPRKVEVVSIEETGAMSLAENRSGEGGIEFGLAGPESEIARFRSIFEEGVMSNEDPRVILERAI